jgi:hypothetical protein
VAEQPNAIAETDANKALRMAAPSFLDFILSGASVPSAITQQSQLIVAYPLAEPGLKPPLITLDKWLTAQSLSASGH